MLERRLSDISTKKSGDTPCFCWAKWVEYTHVCVCDNCYCRTKELAGRVKRAHCFHVADYIIFDEHTHTHTMIILSIPRTTTAESSEKIYIPLAYIEVPNYVSCRLVVDELTKDNWIILHAMLLRPRLHGKHCSVYVSASTVIGILDCVWAANAK